MLVNSFYKHLLFLAMTTSVMASDFITPEEIKENVHKIDVLVANNFKNNKIKTPEITDDPTYLRRAFLVSVGRIPTPQEALQFLEVENPDKRELLADYLFDSAGYKSHTINWLYNILTIRETHGNGPSRKSHARLIDWVRDAVEINMPWDNFTESLLSSRGNVWLTSGAAGYYDKGDAVDDHLSNTLRAFTGVRMECAQCHDDPFQEWEQMDFYQFKAFVDGNPGYRGKENLRSFSRKVRLLEVEQPGKYKGKGGLGRLLGLHGAIISKAGYGIDDRKGTGRTRLPNDYKYNDGDPKQMVGGKSSYGARLRGDDKKDDPDSLTKFAQWMISDDTPQFAQTIAMRLWERIMGISLTPVIGDYVAPDDTEFEELILYLSELIKEYDYDIKTFQKTLMMTKAFQYASSNKDLKNGEANALNGRRVSRMSAEQIWDSLISLIVTDPEALPKRKRASLQFNYAGQHVMSIPDLVIKVNEMTVEQYGEFLLETYDKLQQKKFPPAKGTSESGNTPMMGARKRDRKPEELRRASELPTPSRNGHFLSIFGQSSRSAAIDESTKEGTVSQALELLNGKVQRYIVHNPNASVNQVVEQTKDTDSRIRTVFLTVLNRIPDADEMEFCTKLRNEFKDERSFYRNLVGGLIASQEFYFIF